MSEKHPTGKQPLYAVIRDTLRHEIGTGLYPPFTYLPSEKELAKRFGVAVLTVRQAVIDLESEGLVEKSQGRKTTVCPPKQIEHIFVLPSGSEEYVQSKENVEYQLVRKKLIHPPKAVRRRLELSWTVKKVICITRIRSINRRRVSAYDAYLHPDICEPLLAEDLENRSLILTMREKYRLIPSKILHQVEVIPAKEPITDYLGIREKKNVMLIESTEYNQDSIPYMHITEYYPADRYRFQFMITNL